MKGVQRNCIPKLTLSWGLHCLPPLLRMLGSHRKPFPLSFLLRFIQPTIAKITILYMRDVHQHGRQKTCPHYCHTYCKGFIHCSCRILKQWGLHEDRNIKQQAACCLTLQSKRKISHSLARQETAKRTRILKLKMPCTAGRYVRFHVQYPPDARYKANACDTPG